MTTLVTGGTGFLGRALVQQLVERGESNIRVLTRHFDLELSDLGVEIVEGSLDSPEDVRRAVDGVTKVYHCAGLVERDASKAHKMYAVHVDGTRRLLDALRDQKVERIVVASTSGCVGVSDDPEFIATDSSPYVEQYARKWPYYLSKIAQEKVCNRFVEDHGMPIVQMRPTLLLGPGDTRESSTGDVSLFLQKKVPVKLSGGLSFVDVRDAATAFILAMETPEAKGTYLLGAANWTLGDFFDQLEALSGVKAPKVSLPKEATLQGTRLLSTALKMFGVRSDLDPVSVEMASLFWYIDSSKAQRELGWEPREPMLTLRDTVRWLQSYHPSLATSGPAEPVGHPSDWVPQETIEWAHAQRENR